MLTTTENNQVMQNEQTTTLEVSEDKKPVLYTFGSKKLNLEDYILNLQHNVSRYLNSKNWSSQKKQEFQTQYNIYINELRNQLNNETSSIYTDDFGTIIDPSNTLTGKDEDNNYYNIETNEQIDQNTYNNLTDRKKNKYRTFNASSEIASYFKWVGGGMQPYEEDSKKKESIDLNKHGFVAWWLNKYNPSGESIDLTPYLEKDPYDPNTNKRSTVNRIKSYSEDLSQYLNYIEQYKDYDWSNTTFKSYENFRNAITDLYTNLGNEWDSGDKIRANQAGISSEFYNGFFSTKRNPTESPEETALWEQQRQQEITTREEEQEQIKYKNFIGNKLAEFKRYNFQYRRAAEPNPQTKRFEYINNAIHISSDPVGVSDDQLVSNYDSVFKPEYSGHNDAESKIIQKIVSGQSLSNLDQVYLNYIIRLRILYQAPKVTDKQNNEYYEFPIMNADGKTHNEVATVLYDINQQEIFVAPKIDIADYAAQLYKNYKVSIGESSFIDSLYKQGGVIRAQFGLRVQPRVDIPTLIKNSYNSEIQATAEAFGKSYEEEKAGRRIVGDKANDLDDYGFTRDDKLRLGSIAVDALSMGLAFIPGANVASAVTGVGSSITNFIADVDEDGFQMGDFWNLTGNVALDVLGVIPVAGAGAKGLKLAKSLLKYAPRIIAAISMASTLTNSSQIIKSFDKLVQNKGKELTVNDWRNVVEGVKFVLGGTGAVARKVNSVEYKAQNKRNGSVAIEMRSPNGRENKVLLFEGEDAKKIKNGNLDTIKEVTSKYGEYKDWEVVTNDSFGMWKGFTNKDGKLQIPVGPHMRQGSPKIYTNVYNYKGKRILAETENNKWFTRNDVAQIDEIVRPKTTISTPTSTDTPTNTPAKRAKQTKRNSKISEQQLAEEKATKDLITAYKETKINKKEDLEEIRRLQIELNDPKLTTTREREINNEISEIQTSINNSAKRFYESSQWNDFRTNYIKGKGKNRIIEIPVQNSNPITMTIHEFQDKYNLKFKKGGSIIKYQSGGFTPVSDGNQDDNDTKEFKKNWIQNLTNILNNPTILFGLPRMLKNKIVNNQITDIYKKAVKPHHKTAVESNINIPINILDIEQQSNENISNLNAQIQNNLITSDIDKNLGIGFEGITKGIEYKNQANSIINDSITKARQFQEQQEHANNVAKQKIADYNRLQDNQTEAKLAELTGYNKSINQANENKLSEQLEEEAKTERNRINNLVTQKIPNDIKQALHSNLEPIAKMFNIPLTDAQLAAWNKYKFDNVKYSDLRPNEQIALNQAMNVARILASRLNDEMLGLPSSPYSAARLYRNYLPSMEDVARNRRESDN